MKKQSEELVEAIRRLAGKGRHREPSQGSGIDIAPGCAFGAVVQQQLKDMEQSLGELKARVNGLIFLVIGVVLVEVVIRLLG